MSEDIICDLKWKYFNFNVKSRVSKVIKDQCFCDVTLVSDDQKPFQAHRYVLSAFSPVLKNILLNNPHSHPLIYLRGVNHQELDSILQFIYLGKASVNHSNMKRFAQAAKDLQIKKLAENIRMGNPTESVDDLENNDYTSDNDLHEDNEEQTEHFKHENAGRSISDNVDEIINLDISGSYESESGKPLYNDMHEVNEDQTENGYAGRSISDIVDEIINLGNPGKYDLGSGKQCTSVRYVRQG